MLLVHNMRKNHNIFSKYINSLYFFNCTFNDSDYKIKDCYIFNDHLKI